MPESPNISVQPNYNRGNDFLDNGYANLNTAPPPNPYASPEAGGGTGKGPTSKDVLDSIFGNLSETAKQASPFLNSLPYTNPVQTRLKDTERYDSPTYGFTPFDPNIETEYGDRQGVLEKWKNNFVKFLANTTGSFVETMATIPLTIDAIASGDMSKTYNNPLSNSITQWMDGLETSLPNYETTFGKNHPVLNWIPFIGNSGDSWGGLLKNLGFTAGAIAAAVLQDSMLAAATGGTAELPLLPEQLRKIGVSLAKIGRVYTNPEGSTALLKAIQQGEELTSTIDRLYKGAKFANGFEQKARYGIALFTGAGGEATFEANQTWGNIYTNLNKEFYEKFGRDPDEEERKTIKDYADGGGNASMLTNTALLMLTDSITFGSVLKPFKSAERAVSKEIAEGVSIGLKKGSIDSFEKVAEKGRFQILGKITKPLRTMGVEGFEEGSQFVIQRTAEDFYKRKFDKQSINDVDNFTKSLATGMHDVFTTREGLENIFMGALSGGVIHIAGRVIERGRGIQNNTNTYVENTLKYMNSSTVSNLLNNKEEAINAVSIHNDMQKALEKGDVFEYQNLKFQELFNFIYSGHRAGRFDMRKQQLEMLKDLSPAEFQKMFGMEFNDTNKKTVDEYVDSVIAKSEEIKKNIEKVETIFKNPYKNPSKISNATLKDYFNHTGFEEYKRQLAIDLSEMHDSRRRANNLKAELAVIAPTTDIDNIIKLTNRQGIGEIMEDMNKRISQLDSTMRLMREGKTDEEFSQGDQSAYKDAVREREFLSKSIEELNGVDETGYYENIYENLGSIVNYWAAGNRLTSDFHVSPVDFLPMLQKALDAFRLVNLSNRAHFHYNKLTTKAGYDDYIHSVMDEYSSGKDAPDNASGEIPPTENDPDAVDIDANGNPRVAPVNTEAGKKAAQKESEAAAKEVEAKQAAVEDIKAKLQQKEAAVQATAAEAAAQPQANNGKATVQPAVDPKVATEIQELKDALAKAENDLAQARAESQKAGTVAGEKKVELSISPEAGQRDEDLDLEEMDKEHEAKNNERKSRFGKVGSFFKEFDPFVFISRVFSRDHSARKGINERENMHKVLFSMPPRSVYDKMSLRVSESTEGHKHGEFKKFPGFPGIFYQGYAHDIDMVVEGKVLGKIQPAARLAFIRGEQYLPMWEMTKDEYVKFTRNPADTYDEFMKHLLAYKDIYESIMKDFAKGKSYFSNADVKKLFDISVWYGRADYSKSESSATKISDLNYSTKGDALISLPMVYNPVSKQFERTMKPTVINEAELSEEDRQKLWNFIANNITQLQNINSRYLYIFQLPDGEYKTISPIAARPIQSDNATLNGLFKRIQDVDLKSKEAIRKLNVDLRNEVYIADANNRKGSKTNMFLSVSENGDVLINFVNEKTSFYRAYKVANFKSAADFEGAVEEVNKVIVSKSRNDKALDKLNVRLDAKDFKSGIANDGDVKMADVKDKLSLATSPDVFTNEGISVLPLGKADAKPEGGAEIKKTAPKPKKISPKSKLSEPERELLQAVSNNLKDIRGDYRVGIEQWIKDPAQHPALIKTILDQFLDDPNSGRKAFGNRITEKVLGILGGRLVTDRRSFQFALEHIFKLPQEQALAVSNIYDRVAKVWADRHGKDKNDFFQQLIVMNGKTNRMAPSVLNQEDSAITDLIDQYLRTPEDQAVSGKDVIPANFTPAIAREADREQQSNPSRLNQSNNSVVRAAVQIASDGSATIYAVTDPNVSSPLHELAHIFEHSLTDDEVQTILNWVGHDKWGTDTSEAFARGFERYLAEGKAESASLKSIFKYFKEWLTEIYKGIVGSAIDIKLNEPMEKLYATMLGDNFKQEVKQEVRHEKAKEPKAKKITQKTEPKAVVNIPTEAESKAKIEEEAKKAEIPANDQSQQSQPEVAEEAAQEEPASSNSEITEPSTEETATGSEVSVAPLTDRERSAALIELDNLDTKISQWLAKKQKAEEAKDKAEVARVTVELAKVQQEYNDLEDKLFGTRSISFEEAMEEHLQEDQVEPAPVQEKTRYAQGDKVMYDGKEWEVMIELQTGADDFVYDLFAERRGIAENIRAEDMTPVKTELEELQEEKNLPAESRPVLDSHMGINDEGEATTKLEKGDRVVLNGTYKVKVNGEVKEVEFKGTAGVVTATRKGNETEGTAARFVTVKFPSGMEIEVQRESLLKEVNPDEEKLFSIAGLNYVLDRLRKRFGIDYEVVDDPSGDWKGRFANGKVYINSANVDKTTPFHEYLHPFIATLKIDNPVLYNELVNEFINLVKDNDDVAGEIVSDINKDPHYRKLSTEEKTEEAIVRYISHFAANNLNDSGHTVTSKFFAAMKRLIDKFVKWLNNIYKSDGYKNGGTGLRAMTLKAAPENIQGKNEGHSYLPLHMTLQDIADVVSITNIHFDLTTQMDTINKLDLFQKVADKEEVFTDEGRVIKNLKRRLNVLEDTAKRRVPSEELMDEYKSARRILENEDETLSLVKFVDRGIKGLKWASDEFDRITAVLKDDTLKKTPQRVRELNRSMEIVKTLLGFYLSDVQSLFRTQVYNDQRSEKDEDSYTKVLNKANAIADRIRNRSVDLMVEWLYPYFENSIKNIKEKYPEYNLTKEDFKNKLYAADHDIDRMFYLLGSVGTSHDPVSAIVRDALFDVHEEAHLFDAQLRNSILNTYEDFLKRKGLSNKRDSIGDYFKKNWLRKAQSLEIVEYKKNAEGVMEPKWGYVERLAFHEEFYFDLWRKEYTEYMESLGEAPSLADEEAYQKWVNKLEDWQEVNGTENQPAERFRDPKFKELYADPMYKVMYDAYKEGNDKLLDGESLKFGIVPQVSKGKNMFSDMKWDKSAVKNLAKKALEFVAPEARKDWSDNLENLDGSDYKKIKMAYIRPLEEQDLDLALPETVFKYASAAHLNTKLKEVEPNVHTLRSLLTADSKYIGKARAINQVAKGKTVFDNILKLPASKEERKSLLNKQLVAFIDDVVYGDTEVPDSIKVLGREIDLNQWGANMSFLTALNNMAFNVTAGINNVVIGNVASFGEAMGGKFYSVKNWTKGAGQYGAALWTGDFIKDTISLKKSIITQLGIKYDAIQGEFRDKYGKRFVGNVAQKYATMDTLFVLTHAGEHQIQLQGMLALMDATRVKTTSGQEMSLFEAHEIDKKGQLRLRQDVIWSAQDEKDFTKKLHGINQMLNGNYSKFDKAYIQRKWYGKLVLVYRKYLYNGFRSRYGKQRADYMLGDVMEGYYRTFFSKLGKDLKVMATELKVTQFKEGWDANQKYAAHKTLYEMALLTGMTILGLAIGAGADKKDKAKSWGENYLALMMLRVRSDLGQYSVFGVQDMFRVVKNPSAVIMSLSRYADFFQQLVQDPFKEYKRKTGIFDKGDSVLKAKLLKAIPILRQFINLMSPEEQAKFYTLTNKAFTN
jgi:hypothetical protein